MALNIKNSEVERLVAAIAGMTGESKTEAVRKALEERQDRLSYQLARRDKRAELLKFLQDEIWSTIPPEQLGKELTKEEEDELLGYGKEGV